jgi:hypothetical protein
MTEAERRFARWRREPDPGPGYTQIPADGACLSAFLIVREASNSPRVLLGTPHPSADWNRIGALEPARLSRLSGHLMLPSSHLIEYESPQEAAARIAGEQLGLVDLPLAGPEVVSDAYGRPDAPDRHWDLDFLFRANWPAARTPSSPNWSHLEFADPTKLRRERFARAHDDILRFAGYATLD